MPYQRISGNELFYSAHESEHPLTLVCIHGAGGEHAIWPRGLGDLEHCDTCMLDLPGHGNSAGQPRTSVEDYADDVSAFIEARGFRRVVLLGHSMGGAIALTLGLRHPPWLDAIAIACTGSQLRVPRSITRQLRTAPEVAIEQLCRSSFSPEARLSLVEREMQRQQDVPTEVFLADYQACDDFDITAELHRITQPPLILSGDLDHHTPLKYAQFLEDRLPNGRLAVFAPAGHMLPLEQPTDMIRCVSDFIASRTGPLLPSGNRAE